MRKVKNREAMALARKRWAGTTAEERRKQLRKVQDARIAKAAERRAAREAQAEEPEPVSA